MQAYHYCHTEIFMPENAMAAEQIWNRTVSLVKDRVMHMTLWQTLEQTAGLVLVDDTFVVGVPSRIINHASYLTSAIHRNAIEKALTAVIGQPTRIRVIEGSTLADWEALKIREERVRIMRDAAYDRSEKRAATAQSWEEVLEGAARAWSAAELRALPQTKARYLKAMASLLHEAIERLCPEGADEQAERMIAKVIDRIATNADAPSTVVALELERQAGTVNDSR